ncbi:MAG: PBP1A family penicillin-binding protein [Litorimonas sp.]
MATYRADINVARSSARRSRRARRSAWALGILAALIALYSVGYIAGRGYLLNGLPSLPDKQTMWQLNLQETMTLLDSDGNRLGHRGPWIGEPLKLADMPSHLPNAFLAIEDERFFEHEGVDNKAILRALVSNARSGERSQGGSTLTQQLVKLMVLTPEKTYRRKFQEALLARDMEAVLSKPEILELYINRISLGPQIFGAEAASQRYFGKSARDLDLSEAALIAGLAQAPSRYNPTRNYDTALSRSHLVLGRMRANGYISPSEMERALATPPEVIEQAETGLDEDILGYAFDYIAEEARNRAGIRHPDLIVTVTLDGALMRAGHESLNAILDKEGERRKVSQGALIAIDNDSGAVRAMIGGRTYAGTKFNRAVQAQRQPGSSFKTFVYAAALLQGYTPATVRVDQPTQIAGWEPKNYTLRYRGPMTMREALKHSINTIAAQVGSEIGPARVAALANRFGIDSPLPANLSLSLGSSEVNLLELTGAYTVFANEGSRRRPHLIEKIETTTGETLYDRAPDRDERVYPVPYARQMTSMLRDTVDSGTAYGAKLGARQVAGKTGTSQDYRDAWFIGFTRQMTAGVWLGNDDNSPMVRVTGGLLPADVWKRFMTRAHEELATLPLAAPDPRADDERSARMRQFYQGLTSAMQSERDLATGARASNTVTAGR